MDSAQAGDEVLLAPGTYSWTSQSASGENLVVMKRNVVLRSETGPASTILDAEDRGRAIQCVDVDQARIEGLTITRGYSLQPFMAGNGSGINSTGDSRPSIVNCHVIANRGFIAFGGGINCEDASIIDCTISNNVANSGGGVRMIRGSMSRCTLRGNAVTGDPGGRGGGVIASAGTMISDCLFEENSAFGPRGSNGGGALIDDGMITRCTFVQNFAGSGSGTGGAVFCFGNVTISECVFLANVAVGSRFPGVGGAISSAPGSQVVVTRCTLVGNRGVHTSPPHAVPPVGGIYVLGGGTVNLSIIAWSEGAGCAGSATFSCTDLYANSLGDAICGIDAGGNFSADPRRDPEVQQMRCLR